MRDLHYRTSFKLGVSAGDFLEKEISDAERGCKNYSKGLESIPDLVMIEGMNLFEYNLLSYTLLKEKLINKTIIQRGPFGEIDLEVRGDEVYLHVFDAVQPLNDSENEIDDDISEYKHRFELTRIIEKETPPLREEKLRQYIE